MTYMNPVGPDPSPENETPVTVVEDYAEEIGFDLEMINRWHSENFEMLVESYGGRAVAMLDEEIIAVADSYLEASELARQRHPNRIAFVFEVPTEEELMCLL